MSEQNMPATEASSGVDEQEIVSYELAYHVLPTVAEGEVAQVRDSVVSLIENNGGSLVAEETPQRFDLAYDIEKYLEGKYRKFSSAYFGWVRFTANSSDVNALETALVEEKSLLRYLLLRLSKTEEANPFFFHEALAEEKAVETIEEEEVDIDPNAETKAVDEVDTEGVSDDTKVTATAPEVESSDTPTEDTEQESDR